VIVILFIIRCFNVLFGLLFVLFWVLSIKNQNRLLCFFLSYIYMSTFPVGKITKKKTSLKVSYCQKYTPTDCFFGDFAHWVVI